MHTHLSFYHFSKGNAPSFTVLADERSMASSEHLELEHRCHIHGFTPLGLLSLCLLSRFHTSFFLLWSAAQCCVQTYCWRCPFSMLDTLFSFRHPGVHSFDWPRLSTLQPWSLWCQPLPRLTSLLCLVSPLLQLLSHQPVILCVTSLH